MKVSLETVQAVARLLQETPLAEIEIAEEAGSRLRVRRAAPAPRVAPPAGKAQTSAPANGAAQALPARATPESTPPVAPEGVTVRALAVGVYHLPPNGLEPGAIVQARQAVGIIESLKVPSEVFAPVNARVVEILVEEGQGVGYDEPLVRLEPLEDENE